MNKVDSKRQLERKSVNYFEYEDAYALQAIENQIRLHKRLVNIFFHSTWNLHVLRHTVNYFPRFRLEIAQNY